MSAVNRIYTFDTLKIILIFCVIFHHCTVPYFVSDGISWNHSEIFETIYLLSMTFTMPLFVIISGYFYKPHSPATCIRRYLWPCIAVSVILFAISTLSPAPYMSARPVWDLGYAMWFLYVLFIYSIITPPILHATLSLNWLLFITFTISLIAGVCPILNTHLQLSRLVSYYFFYLLGYWLSIKNVIRFSETPKTRILATATLIMVMALHWFLCHHFPFLLYSTTFDHGLGTYPIAMLIRAYSIASTVTMSILLIISVPNKEYIITKYGSRTLAPYLLHMIPVILICWTLTWDIKTTPTGIIINLILVPAGCLFFLHPSVSTALDRVININFRGIWSSIVKRLSPSCHKQQ